MFRKFLCLLILLCGLGLSAQTRMIPHVTRADGSFETDVQITNTTPLSQSFVLTPFDSEGTPLTPFEGNLASGASMVESSRTLFADGEQVSHFAVEGEGVSVDVAYRHLSQATSPAHVQESDSQASRWRINAGNWALVFDGLAVVNTGSVATDLWVAQRDLAGNFLHSAKVADQLAPNAKALVVVGSPAGSSFTPAENVVYELMGDQKLAVTSLRGTVGLSEAGLLWANQARAQSITESSRDDKGVWAIRDGSLFEVFEMMGYNVTYDRLWQSELFRRTARGTLAEILGPDFVIQDQTIRRSNYSDEEINQQFAALDDDNKTLIRAYAHGVNRRLSQVLSDQSLLPFEFKTLDITQIEAWTHLDVLHWLVNLQRNFSLQNLGFGQVENAILVQNILANTDQFTALAMLEDLRWVSDPLAPTMIPATETQKAETLARTQNQGLASLELAPFDPQFIETVRQMSATFDRNETLLRKINAFVKGGSFAWVVSGDLTESGNPILYSGPQVVPGAPNFFVEGSIQTEGLQISGLAVPGVPAIIVGRTPHHAWSFQVGNAHTWDFYIESAQGLEVHRSETIKVRGAEDVVFDIHRTPRGPLLTDPTIQTPISWKYSLWGKELDLANGILAMGRANSIEEFDAAVNKLAVSQHICYADVEGNIAYWMSGPVPLRPPGEFRLPQGLIAPPVEWDAELTMPLPHDRNPAQGFYGGWNNKAFVGERDTSGTLLHGSFHRSHVITEVLENAPRPFSFEQIRDISNSIANSFSLQLGGNPWKAFGERFSEIIEADSSPERLAAVAMIDQGWNGKFTPDDLDSIISSPDLTDPWVLLRDWIFEVLRKTFDDELGPFPNNNVAAERMQTLIHGVLQTPGGLSFNFDWFQNQMDAEAPQTLETIVVQSLDDTLTALGDQPWGAGARLTTVYQHQLAELGTIYEPLFVNRANYGQCVEVGSGGPVRIETVMPMGQSGTILMDEAGNPVFDPHFFSMNEIFENLLHRNFPLFDSQSKNRLNQQ